ncbi:AcrR family transcriptional regulator [Thermocatellispora tengchongensis]|uniref:AcrR family transcriptional regulator n=1 Tax=Thermocatellispora tengchongensis TaxID=1073253 RepID=A0A840P0G9_9ACTN|nr:TetR/AcrR family transcriptional regulator [Thermocatellispora tengchongensis]MBB5131956.1 AcrR family transcriptional regulator [Thermocatellispora tengchongensis]
MGADRRQAILDAALEIVGGAGFDALTIVRLSEVSGASNGSIYHHFGSRGGVIAALYRDSFARLVRAMLPALDARPAADVVPDLAGRYLDWVAAEPTRARFVYGAPAAGLVALGEGMAGDKAEIMAPIAAWFGERARAGEVRAMPVWALDAVVMGPVHECARRYLLAPDAFDLAAARPLVTAAAWSIVRPG